MLSTRDHGLPLPDGWHDLFDAEMEDMVIVAGYILRLYRERTELEIAQWTKLAVGGKKAIRNWLEERGK